MLQYAHLTKDSHPEYSYKGVPVVAQWLTNPTRNDEVAGLIPGLTQRVKDRRCHELWCGWQMWLRSGVAPI